MSRLRGLMAFMFARTVGGGLRGWHQTLRRIAPVGAAATVFLLAFAGSALALSGTPIKVAEPVRFGNPAVAVDGAGTAYIAWPNETGLGGVGDTIEYCTLPLGAGACAHHGRLIVEGNATPVVEQVQVLLDGSTVVVLASVYGVHEEYEPVQEWTSTDGGATFLPVDSLKSVANATLSADTGALNALVVPGSNALGYAFVTAVGPPTFDEFPLTTPPQCSVKECPAAEKFATLQLEPELTLHPLGNLHGSVASRLGANTGVLGVYETLGKPGPASPLCSFGTAFAYGSGEQSPSNSYDISPGEPNSAWRMALSPGDCEAEYVAVGGGPSGLGVAEKDLTRGYEVYHQFNQTTDTFEPSTVTIAKEGGLDTSVSQDGAGGIYVTYLGNAEGAVRLAYSSTGGASWTGPATLSASPRAGNLASSVGSAGQGWAVWTEGESVYAQQFVATDATPPTPPSPPTSTPPAPAPSSVFIPVGNPQFNPETGQLAIVAQFPAPGTATSSGVIQQGASLARAEEALAEAARHKSSKCKRGYVKKNKKCVNNAPVVYGTTVMTIPAPGTYTIIINPAGKVLKALKAGKKLNVLTSTTFQNRAGGVPVTHVGSVQVKLKPPKKPKHKHGKR